MVKVTTEVNITIILTLSDGPNVGHKQFKNSCSYLTLAMHHIWHVL